MEETLKLRKLQLPSDVERLLEAFIARAGILPKDAFQVHHPASLPAPLQRLILTAEQEGRAWSCRLSGLRSWLFTSVPMPREGGATTLDVKRYGEDGELQEAGLWTLDPDGTWRRCSD